MGVPNRVRPLMKDEIELKKIPLSVLIGAQNSKHVRLRNDTRISSKEWERYSPLKTKLW